MRSVYVIMLMAIVLGCSIPEQKQNMQSVDPFEIDNKKFLSEKGNELFRVLITPESYTVVQVRNHETIQRINDESGDKYILEEIAKYHQIDEAREGVAMVWLFPHSGTIMKIRPVQLTFLVELDNIIVQDLQRWAFHFPSKTIEPTKFEVRYRIVLRKKMSDEEILQQIREKIKEKTQ